MKYLGRETLLLAQQAEQQMFRADVLVAEALRFLGAVRKNPLALVAEGEIDGGGDLFPYRRVGLDLFANRLDGGVRTQEAVRQALSSRSSPSNRCSVSMYGLPNWLASYRAKKMTLRAFSVYRSNICVPVLQRARASARSPAQNPVATLGELQVVRHVHRRQPVDLCRSSKSPVIIPPVLASRFSGGFVASSTEGLPTSARASTIRCCSPPESSPALCDARARKPTSSSRDSEIPAASSCETPRISRGIITFSKA